MSDENEKNVEEEELVAKTAKLLTEVPGLQGESPADESDNEDDSTPESETETGFETKADESDNEDDSTPDETSAAETEVKAEGLPDTYYRAAIHQNWKPDEVKEFYESNPELAKRTFAKIYESVNKVSSEFAALGRLKLEQENKSVQNIESEKSQFKGIDVGKLKENYGDSEPLVDVIEQLQKQNKILFDQAQQKVSQQAASAQDRNSHAVGQQIDTFFGADDLKLYDDFYGPGKDEHNKVAQSEALTPGQKSNRWAVLQLADQIIAGNALQGYDMPISEALGLAHLSVTEPIREQKIREDIISKVVKRSKGITLKGSGKTQVAATKKDGTMTESDLEYKTQKLLTKTFG